MKPRRQSLQTSNITDATKVDVEQKRDAIEKNIMSSIQDHAYFGAGEKEWWRQFWANTAPGSVRDLPADKIWTFDLASLRPIRKEHVSNLLTTSFPNMSIAEATVLVQGMFDYKSDLTLFKNHLRDFLVQTKQFKTSDNSAMFAEEQAARQSAERARVDAIPGMLPPNQIDMGDD